MNTAFYINSIKNLDNESLLACQEDAKRRILDHSIGGNIVEEYIKRQNSILDLTSKEIRRRGLNNER
ncbi:hypothetical protein PBI_PBS1_264 [Bacillus phage PBS1]|uniref:Uncharacterized protein n=1 Tax=Bacillus phage PBS1 TaxID=2884423 RepID=A0A223LDU9_BPPB1|nr:hypothetical protein FK780_gp183 [Bacillus phage PBS1]ASU00086.1 hypothetical protein PBI_PBS1_264 [Bacillus phage PBS1]WCS68197.1 hypothetical protein Goe21_00870 [Bacillus phage vB_BsuM-Goe21]BDE75405.1 hypothetical protein [Bacillus phage PBS1]